MDSACSQLKALLSYLVDSLKLVLLCMRILISKNVFYFWKILENPFQLRKL
jgi:hypothetical protein